MRRIVLLILLAICTSAQSADAARSQTETLDEAVHGAETIALVAISRIRPVYYTFRGKKMACGAVFDASIIKHYKGKKGRFSFFSTNMWFFDGFERQYLVIANSPDLAAAPRPKFEEPPSESDRAFDECTSGAAANNVGSDHQAAFPLIVDTKTGDRALKLSLEYPMASFVALDTFRFQVVGNETCERQFILMSWTDVERAIIEALEPR